MNDNDMRKIYAEIAAKMLDHFIDLANESRLSPNQGISVLTSFYASALSATTEIVVGEKANTDKMILMFLRDLKKNLEDNLGVKVISDFELIKTGEKT